MNYSWKNMAKILLVGIWTPVRVTILTVLYVYLFGLPFLLIATFNIVESLIDREPIRWATLLTNLRRLYR